MVIWACAVSVVTIITARQRHVNTARRDQSQYEYMEAAEGPISCSYRQTKPIE